MWILSRTQLTITSSKLAIKKQIHLHVFKVKKKAWHGSGIFIVDFDKHINRVFLLLTLSKYLSVGCERQLITSWKHKKRSIYFLKNVDRSISFSNLSLHRIKDKLWHIIKRYYYIWTYYGTFFMSKFALGIPSE